MPYSAEVVRRAARRLESARADQESMIRERLDDAYARQPRLREIDGEMRRNMAAALRAAFTKEGTDALEQAKAANQALQRERQAIAETCFEPGYLDDRPICGQCGGSGYIGTRMCTCLQALCRQEQAKEIALLASDGERFENFRMDFYLSLIHI